LSCQSNTTLRTITQQLRAVHEYAGTPKRFAGTFLAIDDVHRAAEVLEQDSRSTAWLGPIGPRWREHVTRSPDNCPNYFRHRAALRRGREGVAWKIRRDCGMNGHDHTVANKGPHGQRVYPSSHYLALAAQKAKNIVLADRPRQREYFVEQVDLLSAVEAGEWAQHRPLLAAMADLLHEIPEEQSLGGDALHVALHGRLQTLETILAKPATPGVMWNPERFPPSEHASLEEIEAAPFNIELLLKAVIDDHSDLRTSEPFPPRVELHGVNGRDPGVLLRLPPTAASSAKLATRQVIVQRASLDRWLRQLGDYGLRQLCWQDVLANVPNPRGDSSMRWILEAHRQMTMSGMEITQRGLAREAGVNPATVNRNWARIAELAEEWGWMRGILPRLYEAQGRSVALEAESRH